MSRKKASNRGKNLQRTGDYIINEHGVKFTPDEYRQLQIMVKRVNRKRDKLDKQFVDAPVFYGTRKLDVDRQQLRLMGEESDIMIRKRSSSLHQFASRGDFNRYMKGLERAQATDYVDYRSKLYKKNYMEALKRNYAEYPDLLKGALMKVRMMPVKDFVKFMGQNQLGQIKEHYSTTRQIGRLIELRESLGIRNHKGYDDTVDGLDVDDYFY